LVIAGSLASVVSLREEGLSPDSALIGLFGGENESREVFCPWASLSFNVRAELFPEEPSAQPVCRFEVDPGGELRRSIDIGAGATATIEIEPAPPLQFPRLVDSNSPAFWSNGHFRHWIRHGPGDGTPI
jgi:hypothetical protein